MSPARKTNPSPPASAKTNTARNAASRLPVRRSPARYMTAGNASASRLLDSTSEDVSEVPKAVRPAARKSIMKG